MFLESEIADTTGEEARSLNYIIEMKKMVHYKFSVQESSKKFKS